MFVAVASFLVSMTTSDILKDWPVPEKYKTMKNPKAKSTDTKVGKALFKEHCASCHGDGGAGDGKKAENLNTPMRDFTSAEVKKQSDGALYYKSFIGRDEMPSFTKKIASEDDRWLIVNYIKTLK